MADGKVVFETEVDGSGLQQGIDNLDKSVNRWGKAVIGSKILGKVAGAALEVAKAGVSYNAQMESFTTNFTVLLGDQAKALQYVADMREMAAKTPFGMEDLASANQTLLSFGLSAEDSTKAIQQLGDISLGNSERMSSLALAFAQISSAGKLTGQDLLQMINAGFNPLNTLAEKTGTNLADLKDVMAGGKGSKEFQKQMKAAQKEVKKMGDQASESSKLLAQIGKDGAISAEMVGIAMEYETSEGGRFYKGMEQASKTMSGLWSTLQDDAMQLAGNALEPVGNVLSQHILPAAISVVGALNNLFEHDDKLVLSADASEAIEKIEGLDAKIQGIKEKYLSEAVKINLDYAEAMSLISQLDTIDKRLEGTPKRLWSEQDKADMKALVEQLVELNPALQQYVGKDGLLTAEIEKVKELTQAYYNLAITKAAQSAREAAFGEIINANLDKEKLVREKAGLDSEVKAAQDAADAYGKIAEKSGNIWAGLYASSASGDKETQISNITAGIEAFKEYTKLAGELDPSAFSELGIDITSFFDGLEFSSPEEIAANAAALDSLTKAIGVLQDLSNDKQGETQTEVESITASIDACNAAITAADEAIAKAQQDYDVLSGIVADFESGKKSLSVEEETTAAKEDIQTVQDAGDKLGESEFKPDIGADDQATPTINSVSKSLENLDKKEANVYIKIHTSGSIPNLQSAGGGNEIPRAATGMDYVPYDNYLVYLHKGEAVLTADEASAMRTLANGQFTGQIFGGMSSDSHTPSAAPVVNQTINFNIPVKTPDEFAQTMREYATYGLAAQG